MHLAIRHIDIRSRNDGKDLNGGCEFNLRMNSSFLRSLRFQVHLLPNKKWFQLNHKRDNTREVRPFEFLRRGHALGPVVVWDHLSVDEQDTGEAQGTIVVSITAFIDDCRADPGRDFSTSMILERLAGLSAPAGLLLLDNLEELRTWLRTADCDCWIEVDASC